MKLFSKAEIQKIRQVVRPDGGTYLITFRNRHGPTELSALWKDLLSELGIQQTRFVNWWSGSGTVGLLESDMEGGGTVYGQWMLCDHNELLGVFEVSEADVVNIKDGFDSGNVTSVAMRAIRIGETGDQD